MAITRAMKIGSLRKPDHKGSLNFLTGTLSRRSCRKPKGQSQPHPQLPKAAPKKTRMASAARADAANLLSRLLIIPMDAITAPRWMRISGHEKVDKAQLEHCRYPQGIKRRKERTEALEMSRAALCIVRRLVRKRRQAGVAFVCFITVTGDENGGEGQPS